MAEAITVLRFGRCSRRCDFCASSPEFCCLPRRLCGQTARAKRRRYAKAHHWTFPNIEYVLWAIILGLVIPTRWASGNFPYRHRHL